MGIDTSWRMQAGETPCRVPLARREPHAASTGSLTSSDVRK
ncbi:hypothetical protein PSET11_01912 [Arthrobacter ulcerisalmonis]|uniref:Uncharacterized protein n=1 Tax=Arthrobacter ulcerisalmonis TaxID=2483813 RepID=A0A3P5X9N9_9MICC|nr:hypothetical protein PSET11_01912 [Arthrobacter ulcerisalmonis]